MVVMTFSQVCVIVQIYTHEVGDSPYKTRVEYESKISQLKASEALYQTQLDALNKNNSQLEKEAFVCKKQVHNFSLSYSDLLQETKQTWSKLEQIYDSLVSSQNQLVSVNLTQYSLQHKYDQCQASLSSTMDNLFLNRSYTEFLNYKCSSSDIQPPFNTTDVDSCTQSCMYTCGCNSISYSKSTGLCHLKPTCREKQTDMDFDSYQLRYDNSKTIYRGQDCGGYGIPPNGYTVPSVQTCIQDCMNIPQCIGVVILYPRLGCWLKYQCSTFRSNSLTDIFFVRQEC